VLVYFFVCFVVVVFLLLAAFQDTSKKKVESFWVSTLEIIVENLEKILEKEPKSYCQS